MKTRILTIAARINFIQLKKTCLFFLLSFGVLMLANAQEFKKFKVVTGIGYSTPLSATYGSIFGDVLTIEPAYRISDALEVGFRYEGAAIIDYELDIIGYGSYTGNIQYYFGTGNFRPFVGGGVGYYEVVSDFVVNTYSSIGFYPRVGFDYGHFNLTADLNVIPGSSRFLQEFSGNYLGIRIGFIIGGGRKF